MRALREMVKKILVTEDKFLKLQSAQKMMIMIIM